MGNTESTSGDTSRDFPHEASGYAGNPVDPNYQHQHPIYAGNPVDTKYQQQPPASATSSLNSNNQRKHRPTYIADNFNSVEEVFNSCR